MIFGVEVKKFAKQRGNKEKNCNFARHNRLHRNVNLIIDIGNTCAKAVCFNDGNVVEEIRFDRGEECRLEDFCHKYQFQKGILSSVSDVSDALCDIIQALPFEVRTFKSGITPVPIKNKYASPYTLGTDRLAAAVGAAYLQPGHDILIVDIGTCITIDFVSAEGAYEGGNISLGPTMRLKALHEFTSKLPLVERGGETEEMGTTTETAIRSGVVQGIKYEIEGYVRAFQAKYPQLFVYLTGGVHMDLHFSEKIRIFANDFIVPIGLNRILEYNDDFL